MRSTVEESGWRKTAAFSSSASRSARKTAPFLPPLMMHTSWKAL